MFTVFLSILRSRIGQIALAILAGVLVYNLWVYVLHQRWAEGEKGKATVEVLDKTKEVQNDVKKREKAVDRMGADDLLRAWGSDRVQPGSSTGSAAAPPR